jgi:hypothetical protein
MKTCLLDTNLLIALFWPSHERHGAALKWFVARRRHGWATCPMTQAGFVRIVANPAFSRDAVKPHEALQVLDANTAAGEHEFWPDAVGLREAVGFAGSRLLGHQQVTDAYLLGLAVRRDGVLASMDRRIAALAEPKSAAARALEIVE